jgi:hypothetical protein
MGLAVTERFLLPCTGQIQSSLRRGLQLRAVSSFVALQTAKQRAQPPPPENAQEPATFMRLISTEPTDLAP